MARREVKVAIIGDARGFAGAVGQANGSLAKLGGGITRLAKTAGLGVGAAAVGVAALGKSFYDAAIESQKVTKQTEAVIKSMGNASNVTAAEVAKLSERLSMQTGVDDELIQAGENILLTFGKVRNEIGKGNRIFDRATVAALDMSVALGTDMKGASIQVGKALNDPIKGITALTRAGVSFTQQQKDQVKALVKAGKTLDAQKLILSEMEKQFGGSAAAQATAGEKLRVVWGNIQEQLGAHLIPVVERLATWLAKNLPGAIAATESWVNTKLIPALRDLRDWFEVHVLPAAESFASFLKDQFLPRLLDLSSWIIENKPALMFFTGVLAAWAIAALIASAPIWAVAAAVLGTAAAAVWAYDQWGWFKTGVDAAVTVIQTVNGWLTTLNKTINAVSSSLSKLWGPLGKIAGIAGHSAKNFGISMIPGVGPLLGMADKAKSLFGFDSGGTIPGPRGAPQLVVAHGGETVLPTHKRGWSSGVGVMSSPRSAGDTYNVTINAGPGVDGRKLARDFKNELKKQVRVRGGSAQAVLGT